MKRHGRQLAAFLLVGGLSAAIDAGVFLVLVAMGVDPVVATVVSFLSAFIINYGGNRSIVFRAKHTPGAFWRYVALVVLNLGLSAGIVALGILLGLVPVVAKAVSMVIIAALNFVAMRNWVFRDSASATQARVDDLPHS